MMNERGLKMDESLQLKFAERMKEILVVAKKKKNVFYIIDSSENRESN